MRLIDADALKGQILETIKVYKTNGKFDEPLKRFCNMLRQEIKSIDNAPTIDAEPVKHGYWEEEFNGNGWNDFWDYTCSVCGKKWERADDVLYTSNFCPNCGAKMSRKDDE